jgi:hypothetical protein
MARPTIRPAGFFAFETNGSDNNKLVRCAKVTFF